MNAKHTPGPWSYRKAQTHPTAKVYSYEISTPAYDVASATPHVGIRKEADACIIAAAPDLFEACERLLGWSFWESGGNAERDAQFARAAIAKAKGEA